MATPQARLRDFLPNARELAVLFGARGAACVFAWLTGFRALSDDDYARISIAQRFAHAPRLDPSGTSWLPAPFWVYGAAFRGFGTDLGVARGTAIALSLGATCLVYVAARVLGASRIGALLASVLSCLIVRYSVLLGVAAVPEVPCAALLLFSVSTLGHRDPALRAWGGLSLSIACLSRYEAWPVALGFAVFCVWDAMRERRLALAGAAVLALAGAASWLALGKSEHGDAWFFIARVTSYRRALAENPGSVFERLREYPLSALRGALPILVLLTLARALGRPGQALWALPYRRCALVLLGMLAFLIFGSLHDGAPTHHAARVLLPIWFFGCVVAGHALAQSAALTQASTRAALVVIVATSLAFLLLSPAHDMAARALELDVGRAARLHAAEALAIDTPDYGFFAIQAGFGGPLGTTVLDDHDPRRKGPSPFRSAEMLDRILRGHGARFVIVTKEHAALLDRRCRERWTNQRFALFSCAPSAS